MAVTQEVWISTKNSVELLSIAFNHIKWKEVIQLITEDQVFLFIF